MKNSLKGLNTRCELAKEIVHELKDRTIEVMYHEKQKSGERTFKKNKSQAIPKFEEKH